MKVQVSPLEPYPAVALQDRLPTARPSNPAILYGVRSRLGSLRATPRNGRTQAMTTHAGPELPRSSALASEIRLLPASVRRGIGVPDSALVIWNAVVAAAAAATDDNDGRSLPDRLDGVVAAASAEIDRAEFEAAMAYLETFTGDQLPGWVDRLRRQGFRQFLLRLVGAAAYHRLGIAVQSDTTVIAAALRRAVENLKPYAAALDALVDGMTPAQLQALVALAGPTQPVLALVLQLDSILENVIAAAVRTELTAEVFKETRRPSPDELAAVLPALRNLVSSRSYEETTRLGSTLSRKIKGARDALTYSADPVAQAANSLIELIDRLLRSAFSDVEVLDWVRAHYPEDASLVYHTDAGVLRPSKRGQALCFAYAGRPVEERSPLHEMVAAGLVAARSGLQALKHADTGDPEETDELLGHLAAVEGFITLALGVSWSSVDAEVVERLRERLDPRPTIAHEATA